MKGIVFSFLYFNKKKIKKKKKRKEEKPNAATSVKERSKTHLPTGTSISSVKLLKTGVVRRTTNFFFLREKINKSKKKKKLLSRFGLYF